MKFNSDESINVLKYALEKEKAAEDFYTEKSETMQEPGTREILKDLARDEHKHYEMVKDLLKEAESGAETSTLNPHSSSSSKERVESIFSKYKDGKPLALSEKTTTKDALNFALEIERQSFNHYSQVAKDADNSETAAVYRFLAGEENKHYIMIDNVLDFIDDPGNWLYEEENLIFRR